MKLQIKKIDEAPSPDDGKCTGLERLRACGPAKEKAQINDRETEIEEIADYWEVRSATYSELNIEEMHSWKKDAWLRLIQYYAPEGKSMKALDVGTGPGFFAIILSIAGYDVSAVDVTPAMLAHAQTNADACGASVRFFRHRGEELDFPDNTFDLIVNRNVTWNLQYPAKALAEWKRVLKPGGRMVYFDANWYAYLFDRRAAEAADEDSRNLREKYPVYAAKVQKKYLFEQERMEEIARSLPLSNVRRPLWDRKVLTNLDMQRIVIAPDINHLIYDEMEQVRYRSIPMFAVSAEKPLK